MPRLRLVFMGTPDLAATCLAALLRADAFDVAAAVSQPDRPKGRHLKLAPTPVKACAIAADLPVLQPEKARAPQFLDELRSLEPDLIAVAAYGQILPQALLDIPRHGCLNVHTSLLPRYRGAAPIQWAILNGDRETGVTIMKISLGLDAGDIVSQVTTPVRNDDTAQTLHDRLAELGADLLAKTIPAYVSGEIQPKPQPSEGVVHARKIEKADGLVDWTRNAVAIWNQIRGLDPWPGAFTHVQQGEDTLLLKLWKATPQSGQSEPGKILSADETGIVVGCGEGTLKITELQREGGRRMSAAQFLPGHALKPGERLGK